MDTGDSMPNTEFRRPNPLDSDTIMDATARLLAPRRALLSSILPAKKPEQKKQAAPKKAKPAKAEEPKQAGPSRPDQPKGKKPQKPAMQAPSKKTAPAPQKKQAAPRQRRRGAPPEPPRKTQPKDSTEQASLMKPYYLDMGR